MNVLPDGYDPVEHPDMFQRLETFPADPRGKVILAAIQHDDWCWGKGRFLRGKCVCTPEEVLYEYIGG